jgi:ubiquitin C-terminal hydrolase
MSDFRGYKNLGLSGLANLGNTCFLNSCMQALSHTYELNEILNKETFQQKIKDCPESLLLREWDGLRKIMWSKNCIIAPNRFLRAVQRVADYNGMPMFTGFSQNDMPEFLLFVIDCFHTSCSRKINMVIKGTAENETDEIAYKCFEMIKNTFSKEYSEIWNLFYAVHVSEIISMENNNIISRKPEPFFMLDLPIPQNHTSPSLLDCFDLYLQGEILEGENAFYNEKTNKKERVVKRLRFWSLPKIMVIDLKRFNTRQQKNQVFVDFPLTDLDLTQYVIGYRSASYIYDLYAVCNHSGNVMGGHYTAFVKNANEKWYLFNDTSVAEVPINQSIVSPKAYCLFYRKRE